MRTAAILTLGAFATGSLGLNLPRIGKCLSDKQAQQVATNFKDLIAEYSDQLAEDSLTSDFTDYSDSVNELINSGCTGPQALGTPTFTNLEQFKAGQSAQPPIPFEQLNLWHTCDTVIIRWKSAQTPEQVTGNIVLEAVPAAAGSKFPWKIQTVYSEFNSGAWLVNLGVFKPSNCTADTTPVVSSSSKMIKRSIGGLKLPTVM